MLRRNNGEEVVYTELNNDGNRIPQKGISSLRNPKWRQSTNNVLCKKAFRATRRKYFKNEWERTSWLKAEKAVLALDVHGKARYPTKWVEAMIELARSTNIEYQTANATRAIKISFPALLTVIHNKEARDDWVIRGLHIRRTTGTCEDDPDPWAEPKAEFDLDTPEPISAWTKDDIAF